MEYEDVFPYKEKYEVLRAKNSYRYTVHNVMSVNIHVRCMYYANEFIYHKCIFFLFIGFCMIPGAHYLEPATPIISQCNSIFTNQSIFRYFSREIGQFQST